VDLILEAKKVCEIEAKSILDVKSRIDQKFLSAIEIIFECTGKVIVTGMGKSGLVGKKLASTFSSTGTPAFFLHPGESSHGDLGVISKSDVILALSYSGETAELNPIIAFAGRKGIPLISMTSQSQSSLAIASNVNLDVSVNQEACPLGLAPTASTTATLALGDALAMALLLRRGFLPEDFAEFHPGGRLGHKLLTRVKDVMHPESEISIASTDTSMKEIIYKMTHKDLVRGVVGIVDSKGDLIGMVTDGDVRRRLDKSMNPLEDLVQNVMSRSPKTVDLNEMAEKALFMMEQFTIQVLFVVDRNSNTPQKPIGILHIQDLLKSKVR
jgi:arabinose-5-phosphate isomerase